LQTCILLVITNKIRILCLKPVSRFSDLNGRLFCQTTGQANVGYCYAYCLELGDRLERMVNDVGLPKFSEPQAPARWFWSIGKYEISDISFIQHIFPLKSTYSTN